MTRLREIALPDLDGGVVVVLELERLGHEQPSWHVRGGVLVHGARARERRVDLAFAKQGLRSSQLRVGRERPATLGDFIEGFRGAGEVAREHAQATELVTPSR